MVEGPRMSAPRQVVVVSRHANGNVETPCEIMRSMGKYEKWLASQPDPSAYTAEIMSREEAAAIVADNLLFGIKCGDEDAPGLKQHEFWLDWLEG